MQLKRGMAAWHRSALSSFWKSCISSSDSCSSPSGDTWTKALTSIYINLHPRRSRKQNSSELYTILSNFTLFHYSKCVCKKHLVEKALELMRATILLTKLPEFFGAKDSISIFVLHFHGVLHDNLQNCWISLLSATLPSADCFFVCVCVSGLSTFNSCVSVIDQGQNQQTGHWHWLTWGHSSLTRTGMASTRTVTRIIAIYQKHKL